MSHHKLNRDMQGCFKIEILKFKTAPSCSFQACGKPVCIQLLFQIRLLAVGRADRLDRPCQIVQVAIVNADLKL